MTAQPATAVGIREVALQPTDLLDLMIRLGDLLAHETELLRAGRVAEIAPLQREKQRLTALQQKALKDFAAAGAGQAPPALRAQLAAAAQRLAQMVSDNELALRIGRAATRRLLDMVVDSINTQQRRTCRYNARLVTVNSGPPQAVTLDRRL
jgi:hypothetical protein